jgi:hypothetical protein
MFLKGQDCAVIARRKRSGLEERKKGGENREAKRITTSVKQSSVFLIQAPAVR